MAYAVIHARRPAFQRDVERSVAAVVKLSALSEYRSGRVVLDAMGVKSYEDLGKLDAEEVMRRLDAQDVPLHPGDKALAVIVVAALADLRRATDRLDRASSRLDRWGFFLAVVATAATVGQLVTALA